ncbi:hypothetical protein [Budvicia diplopodorum]|uniref:hypothetical protein n=1 Tax=Budvicia diplopodorum TaxID=1119056 RepID=UPI001356B411|nr:hypothetical protein [Budvicia diplopodorum]
MTTTETTSQETSITILRSLIADLQFSQLSDLQLHDLSAIAAESAEGLCHGLLYLAESLENGTHASPQSSGQISAWLKASAHIIPVLLELYEQANSQLFQMQSAS